MSLVVQGRIVTLAGPVPRTGAAMRELGVIDRGAMLVENGQISWVGKRDAAPAADRVLDFGERVITPGLVDAHTHPVFGGNRANEFEMRSQGATYQQIAAEGGGIKSTVRATRAASLEVLVEVGRKHARWFLKSGTTTIEAKSGYGLDLEHERKLLLAIRELDRTTSLSCVPTLLGAHAVPEEHTLESCERSLIEETIPAIAEQGLAEYADAFCEPGYFDVDCTRRILSEAKRHGLKLRMHVDQLTCCGGAELAAELGASTADHLEQTGPEGIRALKEAGVTPVLLPCSVYALGLKKYPDARAMIETGLPVVLATDFNPGSSPTPSLPFVMSLACTQMEMTPAEALTACTINAARSLDRAHDRGSLEPGKRADFVVWECGDPREIAYWPGAPLVQRVFVFGREVDLVG